MKRRSGTFTTAVDRWGNSLGLRLPKAISQAAGLDAGDRVNLEIENGAVIIRRAKPRYSLEELLEGLTPDMLCDEIQTGSSTGKEDVW